MPVQMETSSNQAQLIALHFQEVFEECLAVVLVYLFVAGAESSLQKGSEEQRGQFGPNESRLGIGDAR